ncbi:hypothetical protein [Blastococcus montanus]|uniref:hypothetical protein n=1 Tax=Blastococcus montanus TaxID=3144973 RepID=UPI0032089B02
MPIYSARTALPYPHRERAGAGLRAQLRWQFASGEVADWSTLAISGPVEVVGRQGRFWYEYSAEVTAGVG